MFYKENVFMCHFCDLQSVFQALSWSGWWLRVMYELKRH